MTHRLDDIDLAILTQLQDAGRMTNVELAKRLGLSAPPSLRRMKALEESGVLKGYRAIVDLEALGFNVVCFAFVQLATQSEKDLAAFEACVRGWRAVRECWTLSGETDFIMKCVTRDMRELQDFVSILTETPGVRNVRTALALKSVKEAPMAPL